MVQTEIWFNLPNRQNVKIVSVSLSVYYTKLHLQHPIITLFTMKPLKGSSEHGITTIKNRSHNVNA